MIGCLAAPEGSLVRDAADADLEAIVAIYNSTIAGRMATADLEPVSVEARRAWFGAHTPNRRPLWVLEHEGAISGWLSFQDFYGRPAYEATAEVSVYVASERRRHGVGELLLGTAIERGPEFGLHTLLGFVFAHNAPSLRLFERLGFMRWGVLPRIALLDGNERHVVIVGRRVDL